MNRETIASALYSRLSGISGLRTHSRKVVDWAQTSSGDCPALHMAIGSSTALNAPGQPRLWRLEFIVYLYCFDGSSAGPSSQLNEYIGKIESALAWTSTSDYAARGNGVETTLGGIVHSARVSDILTDEGSYGDIGVALVTIEAIAAG